MKRLRCLVFLTHSLIDFVVQVFWTPDKKRKKLIAQAKKAKSKRFKGKNEKNQNSSKKPGKLPFKESLVSEKRPKGHGYALGLDRSGFYVTGIYLSLFRKHTFQNAQVT